MDETTAVVRFIIPCMESKATHGGDFDLSEHPPDQTAVAREVQQIRGVFFELFVEALVPTIRGEKLIWMLETTPMGQKLYELDLVPPKTRGGASASDHEDDDDENDEVTMTFPLLPPAHVYEDRGERKKGTDNEAPTSE